MNSGSLDWFFQGDAALAPTNWQAMLLGLLLSLACGHVVSWVYMLTHVSLSYSRSFVNALLLMPPIVCLVMVVLANNLITAFGMMAVFAIVRFRNILRDTLDTTYILISLVIGMAAGTQRFASALLGCVVICLVMVYLWQTAYGTRHHYDLILNLHWTRPDEEILDLHRLLRRHSWRWLQASQHAHEGYDGTDLSFRLLLRNTERTHDLLAELRALPGVSRVTTTAAEDQSEM